MKIVARLALVPIAVILLTAQFCQTDSRQQALAISKSQVELRSFPGLVFCPPSDQGEVIAALAISFSVWQCAGHGDAAGLGFVH